jgi:uncharacterized small protein (DUF1192 family)
MKVREVVIHSGEQFVVPQGIQRIDSRSTHGWQVRYQGTKMFSDSVHSGGSAKQSLAVATAELMQRIATLPAPITLQKAPCAHKTSSLPSGISGPIIRARANSSSRTASFSVLLPQFGGTPRCATVYIGSETNYSLRRYKQALAKAVALRKAAEAQYQQDATQAKRQAALGLRKAVRRLKSAKA